MSDVSVVSGAILACLLGGIFPWISSEVVVVGAALLLPAQALPALALGCAAAQMVSKAVVYAFARLAPHRLPERARRLLARAERLRQRRHLVAVLVVSGALVAVPPFYLVTIASGVLRIPFVLFALLGLAGTSVRYGVLAWLSSTLGS